MNIEKKEITLSHSEANLKAMLFIIPVTIIYLIPYVMINDDDIVNDFKNIVLEQFYLLFFVILVGVLLHEFLHGITWGFFLKKGFKSIKFGIAKKSFTPYCHCKELLKMKNYRLGTIMPFIVLGALPYLLSLLFSDMFLFIIGYIFTITAGGDLLMLWLMRKEDGDGFVKDHPEKIGCIVYYTD